MNPLSLIFGAVVGFSLGLTGGGGTLFAVPLLVYGLGVPARDAVAISLAAVGAMSLVGFIHRLKLGEVEVRTGLLFAAAGMVGAPVGTWLAGFIPEPLLMLAFGGLMIVIAIRLWQQAVKPNLPITDCPPSRNGAGLSCQRDESGSLMLTSRCAMLLFLLGIVTGVLSGMFGVGGGFVIVPALVMFSNMSIPRAIGTSMMVVALVSITGVGSQLWGGRTLPLEIVSLFILGGVGGLFLGQQIGQRLSGPVLQKVFVVVIVGVAVFVISRNFLT